jgi:hypothetical protein
MSPQIWKSRRWLGICRYELVPNVGVTQGAQPVEYCPRLAACTLVHVPSRLGCQRIRPSSRARATASVVLAAPSLPRMWLTCFLVVSMVTVRSWAMR